MRLNKYHFVNRRQTGILSLQSQYNYMLIHSLEKIYDRLKGSRLSEEILTDLHTELEEVTQFIECSHQAAALLAILVIMSMEERTVGTADLLKYLGLRASSEKQIRQYLLPLKKRNLVSFRHNNLFSFYRMDIELPTWLFEAVVQNDKEKLKTEAIDDAINFLQHYSTMLLERKSDRITKAELFDWQESFIQSHRHIRFVNWLSKIHLSDGETACFLYCCLKTLEDDDSIDVDDMLREIFSDLAERYAFKKSLRSGVSRLMKENLLELADVFISAFSFVTLSEKALSQLMDSDAGLLKKDFVPKFGTLLTVDNIAQKKLAYNESLRQRIEQLGRLLQDEQIREIQQKLIENSMTPGFTILLYGAPGTGKTETALQLARQSGRHLLQVEASKIRSMWVGETEKNIRKVFSEYREAMRRFEPCPVLLFNEADAILGKRQQVRLRTDQMENTLQNIILEELENFEGIFIATTNLTVNLDPAFERRLLYKLSFEKPDAMVRLQIWKEKFPNFSEAQLDTISLDHELTGGQIENIRKKSFIDSLLQTGLTVDEKLLLKLIEEELQMNKGRERRVIGFRP